MQQLCEEIQYEEEVNTNKNESYSCNHFNLRCETLCGISKLVDCHSKISPCCCIANNNSFSLCLNVLTEQQRSEFGEDPGIVIGIVIDIL